MNEETVLFPLKDSGCKRQTPRLVFFLQGPVRSQMVLTGINATWSHSLQRSVAKNVIMATEVGDVGSPMKCNVERLRSMEAP
jgi:hypothetical protein